MKKNILLLFILSILIMSGCSSEDNPIMVPEKIESKVSMESREKNKTFTNPISNPLERIIKKPFGIKINPANSPVQPERFSGYHTGDPCIQGSESTQKNY